MRNGAVLNEVSPSIAKFQSFHPLKRDLPTQRASRTYSMTVERNPTHAKMPFMKRRRSGSCLMASTTFRSISRKSPTFSGIGGSEIAL